MFRSGELPQIEQILNLYLDRINVYPEYVEIHINNIPTSMMKTSPRTKEPAICGLHTFTIEMLDHDMNVKRSRKLGRCSGNIAVRLHIKREAQLLDKNGQKETRAQDSLDSSNSGNS